MKKYNICFKGREVGSIGILYWYDVTVEANSEDEALLKLYDTHEHIAQQTIVKKTEQEERQLESEEESK